MTRRRPRGHYACPLCGGRVEDSGAGTLWHILDRWHNPVRVTRQAWVEMPGVLAAASLLAGAWAVVLLALR